MRSSGERTRRLKARLAARRAACLNKKLRSGMGFPPLTIQYNHTLYRNSSTLVSCTCMRGLFAALVLVVGGWAVWMYVLRPALQPAPALHPTALVAHPTATPRPVPRAQDVAVTTVARGFLSAWAAGRYGDMYRALSPAVRSDLTHAAFAGRYKDIAAEATIRRVQPAIAAVAVD